MYPPTGRCDDLLAIYARADSRRRPELRDKSGLAVALASVPLVLAGRAVAGGFRFIPPDAVLKLHDLGIRILAGGRGTPRDRGENLRLAVELTAGLAAQTGRRPALLCLTSHPDLSEDEFHLNLELLRQAMWLLREVRGRPCRPRMLIAVDAFALDVLGVVREGLYLGFMGHYHLGSDRLWHGRPWPVRALVGRTAWTNLPWRLLAALGRGGEVAMVPAGGLPATGRLLYGLREFLWAARRNRRSEESPTRMLARLMLDAPEFRSFYTAAPVGERLKASVWRMMDAWVLQGAAEGGLAETERGELPPGTRAALAACCRAMGYGEEDARGLLDGLAGEFARKTPYRERLWRLLARRVAGRGTPVVLIPLTHAGGFRVGEPAALLGVQGGGAAALVRVRRREGSAWRDEEVPTSTLARSFVTTRYT